MQAFAKYSLIFNHCYNLKLHNISALFGGLQGRIDIDIIGVNLLGQSEIVSLLPERIEGNLFRTLVYFTDSEIANKELKSHLTITSNIVKNFEVDDGYSEDIFEKLHGNPQRTEAAMYSDFALYLVQQNFDVDVFLNIGPQNEPFLSYNPQKQPPLSILIMFVNSVTTSHVTFQGL